MSVHASVSHRQEIELLQEEILWLRGELGLLVTAEQVAEVQHTFSMTGHEARILLLLINSGLVTKANAMNALSEAGYDYDAEEKIVDVYVCKVRAKLKRANIGNAIETVWGNGYYLTQDARSAIAAMLCQPWRVAE